MAKRLLAIVCALLLAFVPLSGGKADELADLPVYRRVPLQGGVEPLPPEGAAPYAPAPEGFSQDGLSYLDDSLSVRIVQTRAYDTPVYIAYVQIEDPSQLRTMQAKRYRLTAKERPDKLAAKSNAVLAVNADWFASHNAGVIYREGQLLRDRVSDEYDGLFIDGKGNFRIVAPLTQEGVAALPDTILSSFCFGPALVIEGEVYTGRQRRVTYQQRMGIAQMGPLSYMLVCCDGPKHKNSKGLSIPQFAQLMKDLGAVSAYNFDGASSSSMVFNGVKINGQNTYRMRAVGEILYFATAVPQP